MLPLCLPVRVSYRLHCSRCRKRDWSLSLTLPCCSVSSSHCAAEEAEATVQGERGGQEAQAAQSPERGKLSSPRLTLQLQLLLPVSRCYLPALRLLSFPVAYTQHAKRVIHFNSQSL